eukprot:TRINITY_DN1194_c0_g1_i1.p1 TRINITY_DN1194_c0_g1~~TRINITY_DN1194_c0_g1_i1.p1  ORF type:complete len:246 (+),score=38.08 TRINITY_DN1194_c0_g1_i1:106-843(+)
MAENCCQMSTTVPTLLDFNFSNSKDTMCTNCTKIFEGPRFKCLKCPNFEVCVECEAKVAHDPSHNLLKVTSDEMLQQTMSYLQKERDTTLHNAAVEARTGLSLATLKKMLRRENDLRLSAEYQQRFTSVTKTLDAGSMWIHVVEELQERVVREFGYGPSRELVQYGVDLLRAAQAMYPDDQEIREIALYIKYNRCRDGDLNVGDVAPNVALYPMDNQQFCVPEVPTPLWLLSREQPLVLIGGSLT